jgi:hypothetical protein
LTFSTLNLYKTWTHKTTLTYTALPIELWMKLENLQYRTELF